MLHIITSNSDKLFVGVNVDSILMIYDILQAEVFCDA